jgi:hypothetical protein
VIFNALQQTASSVMDEDNRQRALVAFSLGYQLSGLVVLFVDDVCGSGLRREQQTYFFAVIFLFIVISMVCCVYSHQALESFKPRRNLQDPAKFMDKAKWDHDVNELLWEGLENAKTFKSNDQTVLSVAPSSISPLLTCSIFLTVTASASLLPFYSHFQSSLPNTNLPQNLFFLRLVSDAISRPSTLVLSRFASNARVILALAVSRLILVAPLLALATPKNEGTLGTNQARLAGVLVCAFSFGSGFIVTRCYQLALYQVNENIQHRITGTLNTVFAAAVSTSAVLGLVAMRY